MRNFLLGVSLTVCVALAALLLQSEKPVAANTRSDWSVLGYIYAVDNIDQFKKAIPPFKKATQDGYDAELIYKTHLVYERGNNDAQKRMAFQRMTAAAVKEGWVILSVNDAEMSAVIGHPKISLNDYCLAPTKRLTDR